MARATVSPRAHRRRVRLYLRPETIEGFLFMLPWLIGFLAFSVGPMLISIVLMGMNWQLLSPPQWAGLANIEHLLHDPLAGIVIANTLYIVAISVPLYLVTSFGAAILLNLPLRFLTFYRVVFYIPSQVPAVANALLWLWIFNPEFGLANGFLQGIGLRGQQWFFDPALAKPCLIIMGLWGLGSGIVIFLASLQNVPETLHEAAMLDGAGTLRRFWNVTVPMVSSVIFFEFIIGIISTFQAGFTNVFIITNGGPNYATTLWILYIYQKGFQDFNMGYAATLSWALFIVVMVFTFFQFRFAKNWVYYEDSRGGS